MKMNIDCLSEDVRITGMPRVKIVVWREIPASVVRLQRQLLSPSFSTSSSSLPSDNSFSSLPAFLALSTSGFCASEQFLEEGSLKSSVVYDGTPGQYNRWSGCKSQLADKEANAKGLQVGREVYAALKAIKNIRYKNEI